MKTEGGDCGCGKLDTDADKDGVPHCRDRCDNDYYKTEPGKCGCGEPETDSDFDGYPDCVDKCPDNPDKTDEGECGCLAAETDTDNDGFPDCIDECPNDPFKTSPGKCGCGTSDRDSDADGTPDCKDQCRNDPNKILPQVCDCGQPETDSDDDGVPNCVDDCPFDPLKRTAGVCGCRKSDKDSDFDGTADCNDDCPQDPNKVKVGQCGCGNEDVDNDQDGVAACKDQCDDDPLKTKPLKCGCGVLETDSDGDGVPDCKDLCPDHPDKTEEGDCGCSQAEGDYDSDGTKDCHDECPHDPSKIFVGECGCHVPETDSDGDGTPDCDDECPQDPDKTLRGICDCGQRDDDRDDDGTADCLDLCPDDPNKVKNGVCDCGTSDVDSDNDGIPDCNDACPLDPSKVDPGQFGCGNDICECPCGGGTALTFLLKSPFDESMCVDWIDAGSGAHEQNVIMQECDGSERQLWNMEDGDRLKVANDNGAEVCMEWDHDGPEPLNVWARQCDDDVRQKWFFVGQELKNRHDPSYCLNWDVGGVNGGEGFNVYMRLCEEQGLASQHWFKADLDDTEPSGSAQEVTVQITTCDEEHSDGPLGEYYLSPNKDVAEIEDAGRVGTHLLSTSDEFQGKGLGETTTWTIRYIGALQSLVLSTPDCGRGNDHNWQICRIVVNGYLHWNRGDTPDVPSTASTVCEDVDGANAAPSSASMYFGWGDLGRGATDLLAYLSETDSATIPAPVSNPEGCVDSMDNWSEGPEDSLWTCQWYANWLADPDFFCDQYEYTGPDGLVAAQACCKCGGGSNGAGIPERPPAVTACTQSAGLLTECFAAKEASGAAFTYLVCPDYVEQKAWGEGYLVSTQGKNPTVETDESDGVTLELHYTDGEVGCDSNHEATRSISIQFACGLTDEPTISISNPNDPDCALSALVYHKCACS